MKMNLEDLHTIDHGGSFTTQILTLSIQHWMSSSATAFIGRTQWSPNAPSHKDLAAFILFVPHLNSEMEQ